MRRPLAAIFVALATACTAGSGGSAHPAPPVSSTAPLSSPGADTESLAGGRDVHGVKIQVPDAWHFIDYYRPLFQKEQIMYGGGPVDLFAAASYSIKGRDGGDACAWLHDLPPRGVVLWAEEWLIASGGTGGGGVRQAEIGNIELRGPTTHQDCWPTHVPAERVFLLDDAGRHFWVRVATGKAATPGDIAKAEDVLDSIRTDTSVVPKGGAMGESLRAPLTQHVAVGDVQLSVPGSWDANTYSKGSDEFLQTSLFPLVNTDRDAMRSARVRLGPYQVAIEVTDQTEVFGPSPEPSRLPIQIDESDLCAGCVPGSGKNAQARFLVPIGDDEFVVLVEFGSYRYPSQPIPAEVLAQANRILATLGPA